MNDRNLKQEIINGDNPVCLHILGQSLVNNLCEIIREMEKELVDLRSYKEEMENSDIPGEDN